MIENFVRHGKKETKCHNMWHFVSRLCEVTTGREDGTERVFFVFMSQGDLGKQVEAPAALSPQAARAAGLVFESEKGLRAQLEVPLRLQLNIIASSSRLN